MLGKLYSEGIENIDKGPTEALTATGANRFQILWYAVLPQVLPDFYLIRYIGLKLMCDPSILGVIGAGGIGTPLILL